MLDETIGADVTVGGQAMSGGNTSVAFAVKNTYFVECFDKNGFLKWTDIAENIVVNTGLDDILDKYLKGSTYTAAHYVGLTDGTPTTAAGDTMASHAGWTEVTNYVASSPNVRPTLTLGTVASQSVDNSASKASFVISIVSPDSTTLGGAFLSTDSTIGGSSGTLYSVAAFTAGDKVLNSGDTLNVTVTCTAAAA